MVRSSCWAPGETVSIEIMNVVLMLSQCKHVRGEAGSPLLRPLSEDAQHPREVLQPGQSSLGPRQSASLDPGQTEHRYIASSLYFPDKTQSSLRML